MREITDYVKVQHLIAALIRNRAVFANRKKISECRYANLGCGQQRHSHCINIDYDWRPGVDMCCDMTRGLPLESGTLAGIYSEHCLEHLTYDELHQWLQECWRVLKPGGVIRLITPDLELYIRGYLRKHEDPGGRHFPYEERVEWEGIRTGAIHFNRLFYDGHVNMIKRRFFHSGHHTVVDFETLAAFLAKAGFERITRCKYGEGQDPQLLMDTPSRQEESLYVEAMKPRE